MMNEMYERLGFTPLAAPQLTEDQGMDDLSKLSLLSDSKVDSLYRLVRNPGGTTAGVGRAPPQPNRGLAISRKAITNLKLACYYVRHQNFKAFQCAPDYSPAYQKTLASEDNRAGVRGAYGQYCDQ